MALTSYGFHKHNKNTKLYLEFIMLVFLSCVADKANLISNQSFISPVVPTNDNSYNILASLQRLSLEGDISFANNHHAAEDFGNMHHSLPLAVLHPKSVSDICSTIKHVYEEGSSSQLTVAARGHGHSLHGQSQAHHGLVINMESLQEPGGIRVHVGEISYVEASGGELWISILHETLKYGLSPKSWTDYLYLTVGGTLSNAGIGGQAFRHGPQIDNIYQLEVATGKGERVLCSHEYNADLFYSVLGGLGQFGIITRARISLEPAKERVKWIRVLYSEFDTFSRDQEYLISLENTFDYIEGFVIINRTGILNRWRSTFDAKDPLQASKFNSSGKTLYCIELAKYFNSTDIKTVNEITENLLSELSYIPSTLLLSEVSYLEFLDRVHVSEVKLRSKGLWEVPHPWLNLLVPKSGIREFAKGVFGSIITDSSNGPILIYPVNQSKWNNRTSLITPDEDIFYIVAFLLSVVPGSTGNDSLENVLTRNERILAFVKAAQLKVKQYLPNYRSKEEWQTHFSSSWEVFVRRKLAYDPLAILNPGQRIFQRAISNRELFNEK